MSNFQAAAAMAMQAQMSRGKNQVGTVSDNTQMQQIQQISAPAVGALAPLVMPVPDYESANTLKQALEAINTFGAFSQQQGSFFAGVKNDQDYKVRVELQQQAQERQQQAQIAANALNKFKEDQANDILVGFDATEANKNPGAWAANKTAPYLEGITDPLVRQNLRAEVQMGLARQFASAKVDARQLANEKIVEDNRKTNLLTKRFQSEFTLEQNSKGWNDTLKSASESPQAFIESRTTAFLSSLKTQGVTNPNAIEDAKNLVVTNLSSSIEPAVKARKTESENESLQAVVSSFETTDLSVDEMSKYTNKPHEYILSRVLPAIVQNAAVNNKPEILSKVLSSMSPEDRATYENSLTLEYQTASASARNTRENTITANVQDQLKKSSSLSDYMDGMGGVGVPGNRMIDAGNQYLAGPGSTRQTMSEMIPYVASMNEQQRNEFDSISKNIVQKSEVQEIDQVISATIKGTISPQLAAENLVYRHSIFNDAAPIWNQKTGALSIDAYEKGMAALKGSFSAIKSQDVQYDLMHGRVSLNSANLNKAGIEPENYMQVIPIALQTNAMVPKETITSLTSDILSAPGPNNETAINAMATIVAHNVKVDFDSTLADSPNKVAAYQTFLNLKDQLKFKPDGTLSPESMKMVSLTLMGNANSAKNYTPVSSQMEALAINRIPLADRSLFMKGLDSNLPAAMESMKSHWFSGSLTDKAGNNFESLSPQLMDEVMAEAVSMVASSTNEVASSEYGAIVEKAAQKVAGEYYAVKYNGNAYGLMKESFLTASGVDSNTLNHRIELELSKAKVDPTNVVEILPVGADKVSGNLLVSVIQKDKQGKNTYHLFELPEEDTKSKPSELSVFEQKIENSISNAKKTRHEETSNRNFGKSKI